MTIPNSNFMIENEVGVLPSTPEEERRIVSKLITESEDDLKDGNLYFVISKRWYTSWQNYAEQSTKESSSGKPLQVPRPGPIDNHDIIKSDNDTNDPQLRKLLVEGDDYVLVPQEVWKRLVEWYKGGPPIPRKLICPGFYCRSYSVEVYPLCLMLTNGRDGSRTTISLGKQASIRELYEMACAMTGAALEKAQIWNYFGKRKSVLLDPSSSKSLEDSNLQMDQDILLEDHGLSSFQYPMRSAGNELALEPSRPRVTIARGRTLSSGHSSTSNFSLFPRITSGDDAYGSLSIHGKGGKGGLARLRNSRNTSYMNSDVQCLAYSPPIAEYGLQDYSADINRDNHVGMCLMMDEGSVGDLSRIDENNAAHFQLKKGECLKLDNCEIQEVEEVQVQRDASSPDNSFDVIAEFLGGKNGDLINKMGDAPCSSRLNTNDVGDAVEELTVKTCEGSTMAIVGRSHNQARFETNHSQSRHQFPPDGNSPSSSMSKGKGDTGTPRVWRNAGKMFLPENTTGELALPSNDHLTKVELNSVPVEGLSHGGIKTKIFSQSGFSQFFVRKTLKGKGITLRGPPHIRSKVSNMNQKTVTTSGDPLVTSNTSANVFSSIPLAANDGLLCVPSKVRKPSSCVSPLDLHKSCGGGGCGGEVISLRKWLKLECQKVNKAECLYIFRQIIDHVDCSHSQGVVLCDLRPSLFEILKENAVKYVGSVCQQESVDSNMNRDTLSQLESSLARRRSRDAGFSSSPYIPGKKQKSSGYPSARQWPMFQRVGGINIQTENRDAVTQEFHVGSSQTHCSIAVRPFTSTSEQLEEKWYASPEELRGDTCSVSSNIYSLGILLFELLSQFQCESARETAMSDIQHRILPPKFLSENPKEAGFCLWLLHPEASCRPSTRDILQSDVINGIPDLYAEGISLSIEQEDTECELLQHFLILSQEQRQKHAGKLMEEIVSLEADIGEIIKRRSAIKPLTLEEASSSSPGSTVSEMRLIRNINQLESAYFASRVNARLPEARYRLRPDRDLLRNRDNTIAEPVNTETWSSDDRLGAFFDGLCKYARYSKFETRGVMKTGELNNTSNVICSLGFDRDEDYFATAGVSKKIKIFEFNSLFNESVDIHYPAVEMPNRSKLSGVCWNNYIRNYLASSDYDGIIKLWDVTTGQAISHFIEHEKRAWSVDFSEAYPTKLASGSDDCTVKLWNINERNCLGTIRNIANVCCVQFSPQSSHLLAFGSSDFRTYCYDLRNLKTPWCILVGHNKAVSYAKFLDNETLITASTDNSLKLWDLKKSTHGRLSTNACSLTFGGHTNEKNFVGLSVSDNYIACGSETNEVYAYHKSLPMPITSYKFGSIDPISGKEIEEENNLFVSSVCWRKRSNMVVSASSNGSIKVLELV